MRGKSAALAAAVLGCLVSAAPAAASGEIKDACGLGAIGGPPAYIVEPPTPWLDLCDSDVAGTAGAGPLRAIRATLKLAGDVGARPGLAAYEFTFSTARCTAWVTFADQFRDTRTTATGVDGFCNEQSPPCPLQPITDCSTNGPADYFSAALPAAAGVAQGSSVTLTLDPNTLSAAKVPKELFEDLRGGVLATVEAKTMAHADVVAAGRQATAGDMVDDALGDKPVSIS